VGPAQKTTRDITIKKKLLKSRGGKDDKLARPEKKIRKRLKGGERS